MPFANRVDMFTPTSTSDSLFLATIRVALLHDCGTRREPMGFCGGEL